MDFGFFEGESLRWLFMVAVGGSICFGLTAGTVLEQIRNRWVRTVLLLLLLAVSTVGLRVSLLDAVTAYAELPAALNALGYTWADQGVHLEQAHEQLTRAPRGLPAMRLNPDVRSIFEFQYDDFTLEDYRPHPHIPAAVAV